MHGGKRPGAGRPKGSQTRRTGPKEATGKRYSDVLTYLRAVALGEEKPDALRIAAAKAALPFEHPRQRAPMKSPTARQRQNSEAMAADSQQEREWAATEAAIRRRVKGAKQ